MTAPKKTTSTPKKPAAKPAGSGSAPKSKSGSQSRPQSGSSPRQSSGNKPARRPAAPIAVPITSRLAGLLKPPKTTPKKHTPVREGLSLDRKLDILGISMTLVGMLTLLSMLSPIQGSLTGGWISVLGLGLGWGMYIFPFVLIGAGLWFVLRNFERIPPLALERVLGMALLFFCLLAVLHFIAVLYTGQDPFTLAKIPGGGGYVGAVASGFLLLALGKGGAAVALAAWLIIALAITLDITIAEMFTGLASAFESLQDWFIELTQERRSAGAGIPAPPPDYIEYTASPNNPNPSSASSIRPSGPFTPGFTAAPSHPAQAAPAPHWELPPIDQILDEGSQISVNEESDQQRANVIEETLASFGAPARVVETNRGPTITQFGVEPDFIESRSGRMRVRVGKISALADDLALALSARTIRVQAPVPGKGFIGIEVPNDEISLVALRDLLESEAFKRLKNPLRFALGLNVSGNAVAADLSNMPHLLVAGATGSGKSVCVNALICSLLLNNTPDDLRLVMVDPKRVELTGYNGVPHLLAPVVVDLERVVTVLQWVTREMDMRYRKLAEAGCRNIQEYNQKTASRGEQKLPFMVVIIDELADLMMLAPDETERTITRLAQLARATGIHLVIATQRPSVDVVTGLIKANFPARIAFAVASGMDSRVILDQPGAERLLGRGDMLFQAPDAPAPVRLQGVYVSESEIQRLVAYWQSFAGLYHVAPTAAGGIVDSAPSGIPLKQMPLWEEMKQEEGDPMLKEAIDLSRRQGRASISMLQRRLRIGYTRAARLIETMEEQGIIGPLEPGSNTREILDYGSAAPPVDES